ncbi:hypothetical protein HDV00_004380, partial [Rhizophlyctis rosea]
NKPFAQRRDKTGAWLAALVKQDETLEPYAQVVREMMVERPLDRPTFWEVHEKIRQAGLKEGIFFKCCGEEQTDEETDLSDGSGGTLESVSSDDAEDIIRRLRI